MPYNTPKGLVLNRAPQPSRLIIVETEMPNADNTNLHKNPSIWAIKKSESQWIEFWDNFFLTKTPKWFEWMEWLLVLGAFEYLRKKSVLVTILYLISSILFFFYIQSTLYKIPFYRISPSRWIKTDKIAYIISITVAAFLVFIVHYYLDRMVADLSMN